MAYRILIVDDSPVMRALVRRVIELSGFEISLCLEASNGCEGLELLSREPVDLILTDINMPQMDGEEFLRNLTQDERLMAIPVIVISTDSTCKRTERMLAMGAKGYISKPFVPEILRSAIEQTLGTAYV